MWHGSILTSTSTWVLSITQYAVGVSASQAARGQAVSLKEMKGVRFVTPVLCFSKTNLDIKTFASRVHAAKAFVLRLTANGTSVPSSCESMTLLPLEAVGRTAFFV